LGSVEAEKQNRMEGEDGEEDGEDKARDGQSLGAGASPSERIGNHHQRVDATRQGLCSELGVGLWIQTATRLLLI
jgi:hypothetical protein